MKHCIKMPKEEQRYWFNQKRKKSSKEELAVDVEGLRKENADLKAEIKQMKMGA